jgi:hypothetical protein
MILAKGNIGTHRVVHIVEFQFEPYRVRGPASKTRMALQLRDIDALLTHH